MTVKIKKQTTYRLTAAWHCHVCLSFNILHKLPWNQLSGFGPNNVSRWFLRIKTGEPLHKAGCFHHAEYLGRRGQTSFLGSRGFWLWSTTPSHCKTSPWLHTDTAAVTFKTYTCSESLPRSTKSVKLLPNMRILTDSKGLRWTVSYELYEDGEYKLAKGMMRYSGQTIFQMRAFSNMGYLTPLSLGSNVHRRNPESSNPADISGRNGVLASRWNQHGGCWLPRETGGPGWERSACWLGQQIEEHGS